MRKRENIVKGFLQSLAGFLKWFDLSVVRWKRSSALLDGFHSINYDAKS
jgi:hypothetical protein